MGATLWRLVLTVGLLMGAASLAACSLGLADGCTANESCAPDVAASDWLDAAAHDSNPDSPRLGDGGAAADQTLLDSGVDSPLDSVTAEAGADAPPDVADVEACDPSAAPHDEPCVLNEAFGVFVVPPASLDAGLYASADAASFDAGSEDGSRQRPYRTIWQALTHMGGRSRIYVCNGVYTEQVTITSPVAIYGGLSCAVVDGGVSWSYVGGNAQVIVQTPEHALAVTGVGSLQDAGVDAAAGEAGIGASVTIEDMAFASPSATTAGSSSIAASITSSSVQLVRVTLTAGRGADGAPGADGTANPNYAGAAPDGAPQSLDSNGYAISGGAGGVNTCLLFGNSVGGDGGAGCSVDAGFGTPGTSVPIAPVTMAGRDGLPRGTMLPDGGAAAVDDPGADGLPGDGGTGADGAAGDAGSVAPGYGVLSSTGWTPSAGSDGALGNPGQGGAGGSDPLANTNCGTPVTSIGGGGGGAGGCGGAGGKGGLGGGASIALTSVASIVDLRSCVLTTSAGGTGGAGGAGQDGEPGGAGGDDGNTVYVHAPGASGGNGAGGSGGLGGTGGLSVGVLYKGSVVTYDDGTRVNIVVGSPGAGGAAAPAGRHPTGGALSSGFDGNPGAPGAAGIATAILSLM